jgi:hypothetical protein
VEDVAAVVPRVLLAGGCLAVALGALAWSEQSRLIGIGARWWFERVAAQEQGADAIARRRGVLAELHRRLLLAPPADVHVPELFELVTQLSARVATGEVSLPWAAYVYTTYERDSSATARRAHRADRRTRWRAKWRGCASSMPSPSGPTSTASPRPTSSRPATT